MPNVLRCTAIAGYVCMLGFCCLSFCRSATIFSAFSTCQTSKHLVEVFTSRLYFFESRPVRQGVATQPKLWMACILFVWYRSATFPAYFLVVSLIQRVYMWCWKRALCDSRQVASLCENRFSFQNLLWYMQLSHRHILIKSPTFVSHWWTWWASCHHTGHFKFNLSYVTYRAVTSSIISQ